MARAKATKPRADGHLASPLPWHDDAARRRASIGLPQALMVIGRLGDGLERLCLHLGQNELAAGDKIGKILIEAGTHPDLHLVKLEESSTGKLRQHIVINQIRGLIEATALTPVKAHLRMAVIVPACRMNASAANSLLKTLEEPNDNLRFILGCEHPSWLPVTIRSRCQRMVAPRPSLQEALAWLENEGVGDAKAALSLANGEPLHAKESLDLLPAREELAQILTGERALSGANHKLDNLPLADWLPWAVNWAADGARLSMDLGAADGGFGPDVARKICAAKKPAPLAWLDLYNELLDLMRMAHHPVNKRLLLEHVTWRFANLASDVG